MSWRPGHDACCTGLQGALAQYLTSEQELKEEVYALFKQHPELLYPVEEGLTKGGKLLSRRRLQPSNCCLRRAAGSAPAGSTALRMCSQASCTLPVPAEKVPLPLQSSTGPLSASSSKSF